MTYRPACPARPRPAVDALGSRTLLAAASLAFAGRVTASYTDADGTPVVVSLKGPGGGTIDFAADGPLCYRRDDRGAEAQLLRPGHWRPVALSPAHDEDIAVKPPTDIDVSGCATMGEKLVVPSGSDIVVGIAVRDPAGPNFSPYTFANPSLMQIGVNTPINMPVLDHVDLIGGLVIVEVLFNYQGIGNLIYRAANAKDFPMLEAGILTIGVVYMVATLFADLLSTALNPRLRTAVRG